MIIESFALAAVFGILIAWLAYRRTHKCEYCGQRIFRGESFAKAKSDRTMYYHYTCWSKVERSV